MWLKNSLKIVGLYQCALAAFNQALEIAPNHSQANKYQAIMPQKWLILLENLEKTHPCQVCQYYHGKDGVNCAVHPDRPPEQHCRDGEF